MKSLPLRAGILLILGLCSLLTLGMLRMGSARTGPYLKRLVIPEYPPLSRLSESQGTVYYDITLGKDCHIAGGHGITGGPDDLQTAVAQALNFSGSPEFTSCEGAPSQVRLAFKFSLAGPAVNTWAPTVVRMRPPYFVEITTQPPDLKALGLRKLIEQMPAER